MRKFIRFYKLLQTRFFDGPVVLNYPGKQIKGYRSVNVMVKHWVTAFFALYFTKAGAVLFLASGYFLLGGMLTLLMPIYYLSITIIMLFVVDFLIGLIFKPRLELVRYLPESAAANSSIRINYTVKNLSKLPVWDIYVDTIPFKSTLKFDRAKAFIDLIKTNEKISLSNSIVAKERGRYLLPQLVADSSFPFGLWRWGSRGKSSKPMLIYPEYHELNDISFDCSHPNDYSGREPHADLSGQSMEFFSCREFRYGDNPKHIHAPSWARFQQPVVKEFSDESSRHIMLFLDCCVSKLSYRERFFNKRNSQFEASMSLAAAVIDYLTRQDYTIDLYVNSPENIKMVNEGEIDQQKELFEILASLDYYSGTPFHNLTLELKDQLSNYTSAIICLLDWDDSQQQFINTINDIGIVAKVVCVADRTASNSNQFNDFELIPPGEIVSGRVNIL